MERFAKVNRALPKVLWALVALALLASVPLVSDRIRTEKSSQKVEFVMDYRDVLELSAYKPDPQAFVNEQLDTMNKSGIHSVAIYETTLSELQLARRLDMFTAKEAATLTGKPGEANRNDTFVLFTDETARGKLQPMIEQEFAELGIATEPWSYDGRSGLRIAASEDEAQLKVLGPDPIALEQLQAKGMGIVARISNRHKPYDEAKMDRYLGMFAAAGTKNVIVEGDFVPGYGTGENNHISDFASLMNKYKLGLGIVELIKAPAGISTLAEKLDYNAFRVHSFTEADAEKMSMAQTKEQSDDRAREAADRFVLAVKDRNIRLVFLNARVYKNNEKASMTDPLNTIYESIKGKDGAAPRIQDAGYVTGQGSAHRFDYTPSGWHKHLHYLVILGSVALIVLLLSYFFPNLTLWFLILGLLGSIGLRVLHPLMLDKMLALGAGLSSASIAMILTARKIQSRMEKESQSYVGQTVNLFIQATLVSLIGAVLIVGLLNGLTYSLLLQQFFGVKMLGMFPLVIFGLYLLLFHESLGTTEKIRKLRRILSSPVTVFFIVAAAVLGGVLYYYMSRTGNSGTVSPLEMKFRSLLENGIGVRPRTKEFLIGHPIFILGAYLVLKYRYKYAEWVFLFGVIGQVDMVGTFTHLHSPIIMSAERDGYGLLFGAVIGLILIGIWNLFTRGWKRWAEPFYK
ncbi:DUF5693 family protein [Gorillibacterium massiliense]|uniref:DUF5693 family protein n=1 Tax=Gorillibacterium massiliense TaxID=1280390 RepID=UPI0004B48374|nr:DUF5693 family protein [Gorillibacterium massiliense]